MRTIIFTLLSFLTSLGYCQEPQVTDPLANKVVIGFPDITTNQLDSIKSEFLNRSQIISARYVYGNHKEMLILLDMNINGFSTYYDLLKVIDPIYKTAKTYLNDTEAYDFIMNSLTNETVIQIK